MQQQLKLESPGVDQCMSWQNNFTKKLDLDGKLDKTELRICEIRLLKVPNSVCLRSGYGQC